MKNNKILLLAYGNPLRGDDGIGWQVAAAFKESEPPLLLAQSFAFDVVTCRQLLPEHAELVVQYALVLFVDAAAPGEGDEPGKVAERPCQPAWHQQSRLTHYFTPNDLLALASQVYGCAPSAWLYTITAAEFPHNSTISAPVSAAVPLVVQRIYDRITIFATSL